MTQVSEHVERLIVRRLDGDLTAEEAHQLNCELVRNPQARRMLEAYEKVDVLAMAAFETVIEPSVHREANSTPVQSKCSVPKVPISRHRMWLWFIPGAVAAALLAMVIPFPTMNAPTEPITFHTRPLPINHSRPINQARPQSYSPTHRVGHGQVQPVDWSRPRISRDHGKEIIGVRDAKGNLYWIEVDRTWLIRQPGRPLGEL